MTKPHMDYDKNVLAIQSHVVHGYVGNRAATFPLQLRGWNVDAMNTVQFSNHTGYGSFEGRKTTADELSLLFKGLERQEFEYSGLLSGYLPSAEAVHAVLSMGHQLRAKTPDLIWLLDPVMGDAGQLYVKEDVVPAYREALKSGIVSLTTPNYYEVELLTGITLDSESSVHRALDVLHKDFSVPYVVISSVELHGDLFCIASSSEGKFSYQLNQIDSYFTGTGDLFAALLFDNFHRYKRNLRKAVGASLGALHSVLMRTYEFGLSHNVTKTKIRDKSMKYHELRLIQCRDILISTEYEGPISVEFV